MIWSLRAGGWLSSQLKNKPTWTKQRRWRKRSYRFTTVLSQNSKTSKNRKRLRRITMICTKSSGECSSCSVKSLTLQNGAVVAKTVNVMAKAVQAVTLACSRLTVTIIKSSLWFSTEIGQRVTSLTWKFRGLSLKFLLTEMTFLARTKQTIQFLNVGRPSLVEAWQRMTLWSAFYS